MHNDPSNTEITRTRIKNCIIDALSLELEVGDIQDDTLLFASSAEGGLELDSLAALEIFVALTQEFEIVTSEVDPAAFHSVNTLVEFVTAQAQQGAPEGRTAEL